MCIVFSMDIQKINKRHYIATDMYYRISLGLSSKLLKYENGIIYLEITLSKKWTKNYNATAAELAYSWKSSHPELCKALGCKVFIIDLREDSERQFLQENGISTPYDAYKGVMFRKNYMN
ncbi:MAG: hypothetical protein IPN49_08050 [Saprospiraceae bacterium]|nr:hypothetical protein [Saprospiraceae bacterium]MBK6564712.1 hypothetical protein [Saprospiraceae bacterium]MBK7523354.1 hypothetical protein [Saprospiraceae bacterium]MBK8079454.1 hypothetical protein [Saprospiraceae bacterium]MBK8371655.1 hypothetical protein [Saprospiraceae bacterium]